MKSAKDSNRLRGDLSERPTSRFLWLSTLGLFSFHGALWFLIAQRQQIDITSILSNWDAAWYLEIANQGYIQDRAWAFYPGYPAITALGIKLFSGWIPPPVIGSALSLGFFSGFILLLGRLREERWPLCPASRLGWLLFLIFPCSYVFHSVHSESMFLLLMAASLWLFSLKKMIPAAIFAGLAALTRNEGVILAIALGISSIKPILTKADGIPFADKSPKERFGQRAKRVAIFAMISGGIWILWPLFQWSRTGDPLMFLKAQNFWTPEITVSTYFRTFWFGNPWQNTNVGSIVHHVIYLTMAVGVYWFWRSTKNIPLSVFFLIFMVMRPVQGELVSTLRFETILFPLLFFLGDRISILKRHWQYLLVMMLLVLNWQVSRAYGLLRWAY